MKCPRCRSEISMTAEICPNCRSDLSDYYNQHGADTSDLEPGIDFLVQWAWQTMMLYAPFWILVTVVYEQMSGFCGWLTFFVCAIIALIYRNKLPTF